MVRIAPFFGGGPQIEVGFEIFDLLVDVFVVGLVVASQAFATVVHFGLLHTVVESGLDCFGLSSDLLKLLDFLVLNNTRAFGGHLSKLEVEFRLLLLHQSNKFVLFLDHGLALPFDIHLGVQRTAEQTPLHIVVLLVGEGVLELFKNLVNLHAQLNLTV